MGANLYIIALGGYRVFYALNWIYKKIKMPHYSDIQSWIAGIIEILLFVDFLNYRFTGNSMLRSAVLTVDSKINELSDKARSFGELPGGDGEDEDDGQLRSCQGSEEQGPRRRFDDAPFFGKDGER